MISRQTIIKGFCITAETFTSLIQSLPEATRQELNMKRRQRYLKPYQVNIIKYEFGDYETGRFMFKKNFAKYYGLDADGFRKMLIDEFGIKHELLTEKKYLLSPKDQQTIIDKIGRW